MPTLLQEDEKQTGQDKQQEDEYQEQPKDNAGLE